MQDETLHSGVNRQSEELEMVPPFIQSQSVPIPAGQGSPKFCPQSKLSIRKLTKRKLDIDSGKV